MADDPLTVGRGFVERARQRGRSDDEIARALKAAGWDERALAALWDSLDIPAPPPPPEEPPSDYLAVARSCVADDGWTPAGADPWAQEHAQLRAGGEAALEPIFRVIMDHRQPMADFQSRCDLCGVLADIGGERAARYLQEVCDHRTSVGEYEWVRQSARKALARMAPADSDDPEVLFTRAAEEKDPERKTEMFAALLERFPDLPGPRKHGAHFLTAWAWRDAGDEARARHHFAQALLVVEGDNAYWAEWSSPVWHLLGLRENDWEAVRTMAAEGLAEDEHAPAAPREPEPDPEGAAPPSAPGEAARPALLQRLLGTLEDKEGAALPPLCAAAASGDPARVKAVVETGAGLHEIDEADEQGATALHHAARRGHAEGARYLLMRGANPNAKMDLSLTPLHLAALAGHAEACRVLLASGANARAETRDAWTPLHGAAAEGKLDVVQLLTDRRANVNAVEREQGYTPLHLAALHGHLETLRLLLLRGADVRAKSKDGETPLHVGARGGAPDVVRSLLDKGADVNAASSDGSTPLHYAAAHGQRNVVVVLANRKAKLEAGDRHGRTPLHRAALEGHRSAAEALLDRKARVDARDGDRRTPLHDAALAGHREVAELLLDRGANLEARKEGGWSPLHLACADGREEVACLLLDRKAEVDAPLDDGSTPLIVAALMEQPPLVRLLLERGAQVNAQNKASQATALHAAADKGNLETLRLLLDRGARPDIQSKNGNTALHGAALNDRTDAGRLLTERGSPVNVQTSTGLTPLHLAVVRRNAEFVRVLMAAGADPLIPEREKNRTPLDLAKETNDPAVLAALRAP